MSDRRYLVQYRERHQNHWEDLGGSKTTVSEAERLLSVLARYNKGELGQVRVVSLWWILNAWRMKDVLTHRDLTSNKN